MVRQPRTTADADAVVFVSMAEAEVLIRQAAEAGFEVREDVERQRLASTGTIRLRRVKRCQPPNLENLGNHAVQIT
jgi:hypothetical protein